MATASSTCSPYLIVADFTPQFSDSLITKLSYILMPLPRLMRLIGIEVSDDDGVNILPPLRLINPSSDQFAHTSVKRLGCVS